MHVSQTYPGVVLRCRPIGILEILQKCKARRSATIASSIASRLERRVDPFGGSSSHPSQLIAA
ncbi:MULTISPECIES: hypothetical protein [unclassified Bradyrhizobium]|uniref:hypothetical protein n=1 Tax=unclassified Bradyrhizobium TaxID=2631580 RepID=UPI0024793102|nr:MULTISPECIES: hypothetical protein [unclassified Bradyrhizobium]WGR74997.1 inorganic diphosphatase [Bradyrhizobium sp. ISRA426]WGR82897.1 inorganic diphosphatase [Bradyrhizobium sp. ISRA430]WGR90195.1 inorganic diphosphatase [Bradyrhizobium sp. ISRA432]